MIKKEPYGSEYATRPDKKYYDIKWHERNDITVPSPCIDICSYSPDLSEEENLCIGCYRNKEELINWWKWDACRKLRALDDITKRKQLYGKLI